MPTKASKVKRVKAGKGKKDGKHESKADKESDVEKAKANAALWELRLQVTGQSLSEYREACHKLARANEQLTDQLYRAEKDAIDTTGHWQRQLAAREEEIRTLEKRLESQEALAREEKNKLESDFNRLQDRMKIMKEMEAQMEQEIIDIKNNMDIAEKEHRENLNKMKDKFYREKERLEKDMMEQCNRIMAMLKKDHLEVVAQLEGAMFSAFKERDRLNEALKHHVKESEDLQKLTISLATENTSLGLDRDMLQLTVKKNGAQMEAQNKRLSELKAKVASLEQAIELKAEELERQEKKEEMNLVTIQASQVELEKLQKVLAMRERELGHIKQLASTIVEKRREVEEFFHEALAHVKQEIVTSRLQYKKEALQGYRWRFREATAGKIKFPPIRTFHKSPHSTNSVYSDMEAAVTWTHPPDSNVQISDLTWEQKEQVLRLLFAKMNGRRERKVNQHLAASPSSEKKSLIDSDAAGIREELSPVTISTQAPESILPSNPNSLPDMHIT
ncbi:basal body-orientation factor 1 isoform X1 [Acanthochromis polyacanthus]|uniref:basal body-orientation factor 1 isoform X1 n=1 Tax=Acanthochromis polyacanthus TaxID=80966 RepID=UPI0022345664|nr:basal body-orientation factor 1 isoform X1 [Acanthochromis polyacanthus]